MLGFSSVGADAVGMSNGSSSTTSVSTDLAISYNVLGSISNLLSAIYNVRTVVVSNLDLSYNVAGVSTTSVNSTLSTSYNIRSAVASTLNASYNVFGTVVKNLNSIYSVLADSAPTQGIPMTLTVEDGSVVIGAESYISVAEADSYLTSRGNTIWANLTTSQKEQNLRLATDFMVARYRKSWKGYKVRFDQELDWPRYGVDPEGVMPLQGYSAYVVPFNVVPKEVKRCCADLAVKASLGPLVEDATQKVIQETVGPITTKYDPNSPSVVRYLQVDMILAPLLNSFGGAVVKLQRS